MPFREFSLVVPASITLFTTIGAIADHQQRSDVDTNFWARVWTGPIGKSAFSVAKRLLGNRTRATAMTHRATELSLGLAAEQLYESLPKATRTALGAVPALLERLQVDAQKLRRRYEDLQEVMASRSANADDESLRMMRDSVHEKLGQAVGALETIRLNLLRLHAGSATVESMTTHLGLAADVSEEVERLIAAHQDVEQTLHYPRLAASTPV
jgi:serine/threonine-protein kinase